MKNKMLKIIIKNDPAVTKASSTNATPFYAKVTKKSILIVVYTIFFVLH